MTRVTTDRLILEVMATRSGTTFIAREIKELLRQTYDRGVSAKSVSKNLILLNEEHPMMSRRETTNQEKGLYNCRYIYAWANFDPKTGEVV